jgi:hypothetical protein
MNWAKSLRTTWRSVLTLLLVLSSLPASANYKVGPIVSDGRWEDAFDDDTGLEDLNQTLVNDGAVRLNGQVRQIWEITSQGDFQAGQLDQVDAETIPGALQLEQNVIVNPNQLVSDVSHYGFFDPLEPPALVSDGDQELHMAWVHSEEDDIFYRCSTDVGQSWTAMESLAGDGITATQRAPELIVASTGTVYAAWRDERLDPNGDIFLASRLGCEGSWNAAMPIVVAATIGPSQDDPTLAIDSEDNLYLTWEEDNDIYFSRSNDHSQSWSARHKLNDESGAVASSPDILVDSAGEKVLVAWAYDSDTAESNIYLASSTDGGLTWSDNFPLSPDPTENQHHPAVVQAPDGALYVAWAGGGIYISRSLDGGQAWDPAVAVHTGQSASYWSGTSLTVDNQATLYLTWHDNRHMFNPPYYTPYYDIFMAYSRDGGQSWSENIKLNDDELLPGTEQDLIDHMQPAVTINRAGRFFAAWWDERGMCVNNGGIITCTSPHQEVYFVSTQGYTFAAQGILTSTVHDTTGQPAWDTITWTATVPPSTTVALHTRSGNTPGSWSDWSPAYSDSGQIIASPRTRYIQVQAILTTTNPLTTPVLYDITLHYRPFVWEQTTQADFAVSAVLSNIDVTTVPDSVQLSPEIVFAPEQQVNDQSGNVAQSDEQPALAVAGNSVYLAWRDVRNDSQGDIFFTRSEDDGQTWGANIQINDDPSGAEQSAPRLASRGNDVYIVWYDERGGTEGDVYFDRSTDGGQSFGLDQQVNDNAISAAGYPAIATGAGSRLHVTWPTSRTFIYATYSTDAGVSWAESVLVGGADLGATITGYPAPGIATNGSGEIYTVWQDTRNAFFDLGCGCLRDLEVFADRSTDNGSTWGTDEQVNDDEGLSSQYRPQLAYDDGVLFAAWADYRNGGVLTDPDVYFAHSLDGGQNWNPNIKVNTNELTSFAPDPAIAVDSGGTIYISWPGDLFDSADDILFTYSLDRGVMWQTERRVNTDVVGARQGLPALVATTPGRIYLVWYDERAGTQDLYFTTSLTGTTYTSGTLLSSLLDTQGAAQWGDIFWTATTPPDTSITLYSRSGNTTDPDDGTWSDWSAGYTASPATISTPIAQYLQYRVDLATEDPYVTPILHDVGVEYGRYPLQGSAVSIPVAPPTGFGEWQTVTFNASIPPGTTLTFDVLDSEGNVLLEDVSSGASLTGYPPAQYPVLRLRVNLATSDSAVTPALNDWALTWRPPPAENHVRVVDENGEPAGNSNIYYNDAFLGTTDHLGLLDLPGPPQVNETLSALWPLAERPTGRGVHDSWTYRTYLTNLTLDADGVIHPFIVSGPGEQRLVVHQDNPLILFNIVVSVEWNADEEYLKTIENAFVEASAYLYDVTDGQMAFEQVTIYDNGEHWAHADFQISTKNTVRPYAFIGGITSDDIAHSIRVGRFWNGSSGNQGDWNQPYGYRTLIHEFGHYGLYLYDEYFVRLLDAEGHFIGQAPAACTGLDVIDNSSDDTNASLMYYQYNASELADSDRWTVNCLNTEQARVNDESDWQTVLDRYGGAEWALNTPSSRGSVMAGPDAFPAHLLPFPTIEVHDVGEGGIARQLTVLGQDGNPFPNALVALYTTLYSYTVAIDQGLTGQDGQLTVYGAAEGDTIQAASFDGAYAGAVMVGTDTTYTLTLSSTGSGALAAQTGRFARYLGPTFNRKDGIQSAFFDNAFCRAVAAGPQTNTLLSTTDPRTLATQDSGFSPYLNLIPGSEGDTLLLEVHGAPVGSLPLKAVVIPGEGGGSPQSASLVYSPAEDAYVGQVSFAGVGLGSGETQVSGVAGGQWVSINSDYNLMQVLDNQTNDLASEDGNFQLHIDDGSLLNHADAYAVVLPTGYVPGPMPEGMQVVGSAYEVRFSGAATGLTKPGVLTMYYHPDVMGSATNLAIHHWDAATEEWEHIGGEWVELDHSVAVTVEQFGIYALADLTPYFTLDVQPETHSLVQGESAVYTVTLSAQYGFTDSVDLSASGLPTSTNATFGNNPLTPPASTPLTITTTTSTPADDYVLQVQATGDGITRTQLITLEVQPRSTFILDVQPETHSLIQGESAVYTITLSAHHGFAGSVYLGVSGLPSGTNATFGSDPLIPPASTPLTITTSTSTPANDYVLQVQATGGGISHTQSVTLEVQPQIIHVYLPLILKYWSLVSGIPVLD